MEGQNDKKVIMPDKKVIMPDKKVITLDQKLKGSLLFRAETL
jgi:hypothetical protein